MVSLALANACIFALALLRASICAALRKESSAGWLAAALLCGAVEVFVLISSDNPTTKLAFATLLVPAAYLCVGQTTRIIAGSRRQHRVLIGAVVALGRDVASSQRR